jgi:hypothetical protein
MITLRVCETGARQPALGQSSWQAERRSISAVLPGNTAWGSSFESFRKTTSSPRSDAHFPAPASKRG